MNCTSVYKEKPSETPKKDVSVLITFAVAHGYSRQPVVWCVAFVEAGSSTRIFVNPHILYNGTRPDMVAVLGSFCNSA